MEFIFLLTFYNQLALTLTSCSLVSPPSGPATWLPFTSMGCGASSEQHKDTKDIRAFCFESGMETQYGYGWVNSRHLYNKRIVFVTMTIGESNSYPIIGLLVQR